MWMQEKWLSSFVRLFELSGVGHSTSVALLSETESRSINLQLCEIALARLGAQWLHVRVPSKPQSSSLPMRSTGASDVLGGAALATGILAAAEVIVDCSVEGLLHSVELKQALAGGARLLMISNEHPDVLERVGHDVGLRERVLAARELLRQAQEMTVTSRHGTNLHVQLEGAAIGGNWGFCTDPGTRAHWPGGLVACVPAASKVNGRVVLAPADANLTFKRYIETPVQLDIENDFVVDIQGEGVDAELFRSYTAAWKDPQAYAVSHVGWGLNPSAHWESLAMYDKNDVNGTELRVFEGNFLFSTGANEHAGRYTQGHFDIPMRGCSVYLDGKPVVLEGKLCE